METGIDWHERLRQNIEIQQKKESEEKKRYELEKDRISGIVSSPCENYYGGAIVYELDGNFWLEIEDVTLPPKRVMISQGFYRAFSDEFG